MTSPTTKTAQQAAQSSPGSFVPPSVEGVLDLTFLDIRDDAEFHAALTTKLSEVNSTRTARSTSRESKGTKAIRISNNLLKGIEIIYSIPARLDSSRLLWLDLSFNQIQTIASDFDTYFPNLTTIYLHANTIARLSEIKKLGQLQKLRSLTLYGNPVEEHKHYRNFVLYHCPQLTQFDKSPVTNSQRQKLEVWTQIFRKKLAPSEEEDA